MKHFGLTFRSISIAGCAVLICAVLAVMSAGCTFAHADRFQNLHHHSEGNSSVQNAFCAWAYQAASDIIAAAQPPLAVTWLAVEQQVLAPDSHCVSSRFPP